MRQTDRTSGRAEHADRIDEALSALPVELRPESLAWIERAQAGEVSAIARELAQEVAATRADFDAAIGEFERRLVDER
jgi:hypothetical protein